MTQPKREIEPGAIVAVPVRFVAKAGVAGDWAMYMGPLEWSDGKIASSGVKVFKETAKKILLETLTNNNSELAPFRDLKWRD